MCLEPLEVTSTSLTSSYFSLCSSGYLNNHGLYEGLLIKNRWGRPSLRGRPLCPRPLLAIYTSQKSSLESFSCLLLVHMPTNNKPNILNHPFVSQTPKVTFLNPSVHISYIHPTTYIIHIICNTQSHTYNQSIHKKTHSACCDLILSHGLLGNLLPRP